MKKITRTGERIVLDLEPGEAAFLRDLPALVRSVLAGKHPTRDKLLPRFADDASTDHELRALLEDDLRQRKIERCEAFACALAASTGNGASRVELTLDAAEQWLALLTDLRLVMAAEIGIEDESWSKSLTGERRNARDVRIYLYLTGLQAALLEEGFGIEPPAQPDP